MIDSGPLQNARRRDPLERSTSRSRRGEHVPNPYLVDVGSPACEEEYKAGDGKGGWVRVRSRGAGRTLR